MESIKARPLLGAEQKTGGWLNRFAPILTLTAICWVVFAVNHVLWSGHLNRFGIVPRHLSGLMGILWSPFLHGSLKHLMANTVPLLVLGAILCLRSKAEFGLTTVGGILLGGALTWLFARMAIHVGASGLVFCYFGYLASLAFFNRNFATLCVSVVCVLVYGGVLKGVLPTAGPVSWEGHLAGLSAGIILAWFLSKVKQTPQEKL